MNKSHSVIGGFFLRTLLGLVPALAIWYVARNYVAMPPAWLAETVMKNLFPFWAYGSELQGTTQTLLTGLSIQAANGQLGELAPEANVLTYAYGAPLLVALLLGVRSNGLIWKIPVGIAALFPFQAWGVCFTWLLQVGVVAADATRGQTRFDNIDTNLIAAGYQLGFLLLPTLAPILVWLAMDKRLIQHVVVEGALRAGE
jgi:hypothetical protein